MSRKNTRDKINGAFKRHVLVFLRFKTLKTLLTPLEGGGEPKGKREIRLIFFVFLLLFYTFHRLNTRCTLVRPDLLLGRRYFFLSPELFEFRSQRLKLSIAIMRITITSLRGMISRRNCRPWKGIIMIRRLRTRLTYNTDYGFPPFSMVLEKRKERNGKRNVVSCGTSIRSGHEYIETILHLFFRLFNWNIFLSRYLIDDDGNEAKRNLNIYSIFGVKCTNLSILPHVINLQQNALENHW